MFIILYPLICSSSFKAIYSAAIKTGFDLLLAAINCGATPSEQYQATITTITFTADGKNYPTTKLIINLVNTNY